MMQQPKPILTEEERKILQTLLNKYRKPLDLKEHCFDKQLAFVADPHPFKTAVCSRRAGKTVGVAAYLINAAQTYKGTTQLYVTLSRANAKRILWPELKDRILKAHIPSKINEAELSATLDNGSVIYLSGAHHAKEIDKFRGLAIKTACLDEAQSFRPHIKELVDDVLAPATFDHAGTIMLTGTPGPIAAGYFYDCATSAAWSHHAWTLFDNPYIKTKSGMDPQALLERELTRRGVSASNPTIQREFFGRWVSDTTNLVLIHDPAKNTFRDLPQSASPWDYVVGVDLGFEDSDAVAVLAFNPDHENCYLVYEYTKPKQGITELVNVLQEVMTRFDPFKMVVDAGGLGKKIAVELRQRYQIPIVASDKHRKNEYYALLNDALTAGRFKTKPDSIFAKDTALIEWDKERSRPDRLVVSRNFHSDIVDAVLYAYRESLHWQHTPKPTLPKAGSPEYIKALEDELEDEALRLVTQRQEDDWGIDDGW